LIAERLRCSFRWVTFVVAFPYAFHATLLLIFTFSDTTLRLRLPLLLFCVVIDFVLIYGLLLPFTFPVYVCRILLRLVTRLVVVVTHYVTTARLHVHVCVTTHTRLPRWHVASVLPLAITLRFVVLTVFYVVCCIFVYLTLRSVVIPDGYVDVCYRLLLRLRLFGRLFAFTVAPRCVAFVVAVVTFVAFVRSVHVIHAFLILTRCRCCSTLFTLRHVTVYVYYVGCPCIAYVCLPYVWLHFALRFVICPLLFGLR